MATTGLWPIKGSLKMVIDYADNPDKTTLEKYVDSDLYAALRYTENDDKTDQKIFVTGINCSKHTAYEQMMATKHRFGKFHRICVIRSALKRQNVCGAISMR